MRASALLVVVAIALAGCAKPAAPAPVEDIVSAVAGPSAEELARTPGTLAGIVRTAALEPIANATLTVPRESRTVTTNEAGLFRIEALPPGEHMVTIAAKGFVTRSLTAAVRNGTLSEVDIVLERAGSTEPYHETIELAGFLSCSARAATPMGEELRDCASADPNHRDAFEFEVGEKAKQVVVELVWTPDDNPAGKRLTLFLETAGYGALDLDLGNATGEGYAAVRAPVDVVARYYPEGGLMRARVELTPTEPVAIAAQARFTVYVTAFYHEPAPEGFSVLQTS